MFVCLSVIVFTLHSPHFFVNFLPPYHEIAIQTIIDLSIK